VPSSMVARAVADSEAHEPCRVRLGQLIDREAACSSIDALAVCAWEVSTWSTRSAASMNDVDTDERRLMMGRRGMVPRHTGARHVLLVELGRAGFAL
jgi:hypothetical protein